MISQSSYMRLPSELDSHSGNMKVKPTLYRGIEFVKINDLPEDQQLILKSTPNGMEFVKILIYGRVSEQCILYSSYSNWYSSVFKQPASNKKNQLKNKDQEIDVTTKLNS